MLQGGPVTLIDIPFEVYATKFGECMPAACVLVWTAFGGGAAAHTLALTMGGPKPAGLRVRINCVPARCMRKARVGCISCSRDQWPN